MDGSRGIIVTLMVVGLLVLAPVWVRAQVASPATEDNVAELVFPPDAPAYGLSYEAWIARFGQWHLSVPMAINPVTDPTGERCGYGQAGPVFFLVQSSEGTGARTCVVPAGTVLLIPLLDTSCSTGEDFALVARGGGELRACIEAQLPPHTKMTAVIDGVAIALERFRIQSDLFTVTLARDNWLDVRPAVLEDGVGGSWLLLAPLPPGEHKLRFGASLPRIGVVYEVTYHLTVAEPVVVKQRVGGPPVSQFERRHLAR
jgi:hypothetical protein